MSPPFNKLTLGHQLIYLGCNQCWLFINLSLTRLLTHLLTISLSHALFTLRPVGGGGFSYTSCTTGNREQGKRAGKGSEELMDELVLPHCLCFPRQVHLSLKQNNKNSAVFSEDWTLFCCGQVVMKALYMNKLCPFHEILY